MKYITAYRCLSINKYIEMRFCKPMIKLILDTHIKAKLWKIAYKRKIAQYQNTT